jgi:hypothetical protein
LGCKGKAFTVLGHGQKKSENHRRGVMYQVSHPPKKHLYFINLHTFKAADEKTKDSKFNGSNIPPPMNVILILETLIKAVGLACTVGLQSAPLTKCCSSLDPITPHVSRHSSAVRSESGLPYFKDAQIFTVPSTLFVKTYSRHDSSSSSSSAVLQPGPLQ